MPMLDVSWVVQDPMLADVGALTVRRREDRSIGHGRTQPTVIETFPGVTGVVTQQDAGMLMRKEEGQIIPRRILVCTTFALRGVSKEGPPLPLPFQPDLVDWNGTTYVVVEVMSYQRFGPGITEAVCESMTAVDVPQ